MGALSVDELRRLVNGYQVSQAIHVAVVLGIPDLLADGPRPNDELAEAAGADAPTLYRLLRALASIGVFEEQDGQRFALAPFGELLRSDRPGSLAGWAAFVGTAPIWAAWGQLLHSVQTGENAFAYVHGTDVWQFRAAHPEQSETFDRAMLSLTRLIAGAVIEAYDFSRFAVVADIAGGRGALLEAILAAHPSVRGILFDQEHVVAAADLGDRCTIVGGDFFEEVPGGVDAYLLKDIIHDWEHPEAVRLLQAVRKAMPPDAVVLLIEKDIGGPNERPEAKFSDLNMLVNPGGRERTTQEYASLLADAGLRLAGVTPTASLYAVFEAVAS